MQVRMPVTPGNVRLRRELGRATIQSARANASGNLSPARRRARIEHNAPALIARQSASGSRGRCAGCLATWNRFASSPNPSDKTRHAFLNRTT